MMAARAANGCAVLRSAASPPLSVFRCRLSHLRTALGLRISPSPSDLRRRRLVLLNRGGCELVCSVHSLVDSVLEELEASRERRSKREVICAASKVGLTSSDELLEGKHENQVLKKGSLLEFKKDSERILLGVAQKPDGKKNWMVIDQNGVASSIKPQQVTFIVPGVDNFDNADISDFIQKVEENLDPSLLEMAWIELLDENKSVTVPELAEILFGSVEPIHSYSAHLLLSKDEIYFAAQTRSRSVYAPRPVVQVEELVRKKHAKEAAEKEFQEFIQLLNSARAMPSNAKPSKSSWLAEEKNRYRIEALEAYAIDAYQADDLKKEAERVLKELGRAKASSSALNLLLDIGYFPVHVNLDLLKLKIRTSHSEEIILAAENLLSDSSDPDQNDRKNLTHLKVYAIDVDDADELDDALSATRLQDDRIKVWIHVADPARYVQPGSIVDREALLRGTSVFLPTATYPMFPEKLAMEGMSLKQGEICNAVTVSVVLHPDGSIAEYSVDNSVIRPTYMLTYESASQLIYMDLEEEVELRILREAAALRLKWRKEQGAIDTPGIDARIKVTNPEDPEPSISLYVENQADPGMRLVSEMMILCGEVIATYGSAHGIPLPYRGQPQPNIDLSAFAHLPVGPVRNAALFKMMRAAEMDYKKPIRHGALGIPGYVQFTSPIRRYMDLLAHYQVKAFLRGDSLPFTSGQLEGIASIVNMQFRLIRKISNNGFRYWMIEYLRRQPKGKSFRALILRIIKDRSAAVLLVEIGFQDSAWVSEGAEVGDEVDVEVEVAHPRSDTLTLKQVE